MKKRRTRVFSILALIAVFVIQTEGFKIIAFADDYEAVEGCSQTADLYQLDDTSDDSTNNNHDYLLPASNGFFLSDTAHQNGENPYPYGSEGAGVKVTDNSADGKTYGAGHAFDCQHNYQSQASGLSDPYIESYQNPYTGRDSFKSHALTNDEYLKLSYNQNTTNYTITLYRKTNSGSGTESGSEQSGSGSEGSSETPSTPESTPEPAPEPASEPAPEPAPIQQEEVSEPTVFNEITVVNTVAGSALPTTELGNAELNTKTVFIDVYELTPIQYSNAIQNTITTAPVGGAVVIETNNTVCLDRNMIQALSSRPDISFNLVFKNGGIKYRITIPAGYNVLDLLDSNGYCGYEYLISLFGATVLSNA